MGNGHQMPNAIINRHLVSMFVVALVSLFQVGCGFQPLYSQAGAANSQALSSVAILPISDRRGQILRKFLLERMSTNLGTQSTKFTLRVELSESKSNINIGRDESATRANLFITAKFALTRRAGGGKYSGQILSTNSYNVLDSDFATLSAENDARNRALKSLAEEIRLRVATALNNPSVFTVPAVVERRVQ
tara:strand:- start:32254 stop:32826 length:573 start_codon:yes stop_codon:yes gene_type:complete